LKINTNLLGFMGSTEDEGEQLFAPLYPVALAKGEAERPYFDSWKKIVLHTSRRTRMFHFTGSGRKMSPKSQKERCGRTFWTNHANKTAVEGWKRAIDFGVTNLTSIC
jgi:hypothetical protein